jgi:hypothetical protein
MFRQVSPQPFRSLFRSGMACTGPLGAACMCPSLAGWQPDSARGPFAAYPGLEKGAARVSVGSAIAGLS